MSGEELLTELPALLTVAEAAKLLRISKPHAYAQIRQGNLPSLKLGGKIMVPSLELVKLLGQEPARPEPWDELQQEIRVLHDRLRRAALILAGEERR